ncbi:MAG: hypothetical protein ACFFBP_06690 [Promethearchaeota archaeon]
MIKKRDFYHQSIKYSFNWNLQHHKEKLAVSRTNREEFRKLGSYFKKVYQTSLVPNDIFNSRNIQRISNFKIKGLKNGFIVSFGKQLIRQGIIKKYGNNYKLSKYAQGVFENYKENKINKIPGHEPILKNILIKDKDSIAIEVPIWSNINGRFITGHIDLIQIDADENVIKVIDYKPEGNFMISIPQVASYGLLLKKLLKVTELKCLSFNKIEAWEYDPHILLTDVKEYLISQGIKSRVWEKYL